MTIPTRTTRPNGELQGAAPVPHQVRRITVTIEQLPGGRWRLTQPRVPGWVQAARTAGELAAALRQGFTEAQVAAHSDWKRAVYDAAIPTHRRSCPLARGRRRRDVYEPTEWRVTHDGRWISPRGHVYEESRQTVQQVMVARESMGLSARPDPVSRDYVRPRTRTVQSRDWTGALVALKTGPPVRLTKTSEPD